MLTVVLFSPSAWMSQKTNRKTTPLDPIPHDRNLFSGVAFTVDIGVIDVTTCKPLTDVRFSFPSYGYF
jgi:hypothetical protein